MIIIVIVLIYMIFFCPVPGRSYQYEKVITKASWYSQEESKGRCADGSIFNDKGLTAASWDYPLGSYVLVWPVGRPDLSITVKISDRGPAKKIYRRGISIDLSKGAFERLDDLAKGIIEVEIVRIK